MQDTLDLFKTQVGHSEMNSAHKFRVYIQLTEAPAVYLATSPDIPGLTLETATLDEMMREARYVIPHLLYHNCGMRPGDEIEIHLSKKEPVSSNADALSAKWVLDQEIVAAIEA